MIDARNKGLADTNVEAASDASTTHHKSCNERLGIWMALGTLSGNDPAFHTLAAEAAKK